jgi:DnaJ-class molecular chaperone
MWDFSFQKESTDNHDWTPGRLGAGYIHARTNTPDSFNLLDYSIRTWSVGPDYTDDIDREYQRIRATDVVVFKFYITPTGGIHDRGEGFKNRTGKSDRSVIAFLHRKDNRFYDGRNDIKTSATEDSALHFNYFTGEPCYCGFGQPHGLEKEANLKYKDIKRGELPEGLEGEAGRIFQDYIIALAEGGEVVGAGGNTETIAAIPGIKKVIPWIVGQMKKGTLHFESSRRSSQPGFERVVSEGRFEFWSPGRLENIANLFNAEGSPYQNKLVECSNCEGQGEIWDREFGAHVMCNKCMAIGTAPSNQKENLMELSPIEIKIRAVRHKGWVEEREAEAMRKADVKNQERVYEFTDPEHEGWFVTKLNPDAGEAKRVGIEQGNCFQQEAQGYQERVAEGDLTVYILRDSKGLGHALWAYDRTGKIEVMEDSSKLYNKRGKGWIGYEVNNQWIRNMINEASDALGMQKRYHKDNYDVQLPDVLTVDQFLIQFSNDDSDAYKQLVAKSADEQGIDADMVLEVIKGRVDWRSIVGDLFNGPTTGNSSDKQIPFNDFIKIMEGQARLTFALNQFAQEADRRISDPEVEANQRNQDHVNDYKEWKKIHTHPYTGEYTHPETWGNTAWHKNDYEEFRENFSDSPWAFSLPDWETFISEWGGKLPASLNPAYRQGKPVIETNVCKRCGGSGRLITSDGYATCDRCWGNRDERNKVVFPDPESDAAKCQSCAGSGVDQSKVQHLKQQVEQLKADGVHDRLVVEFERTLGRKDLQNTDLRCNVCKGSGKNKPAARLMEEGSGQLKFGKKKQDDYIVHFDSITGEPCTCGFGAYRNTNEDGERFFKEASGYKFKEIKKNPPSFLQNEEGQSLIDYLTLLVKGVGENPQPLLEGAKTLVPWIVKQFKEGNLTYNPNEDRSYYTGIERVYPGGNTPIGVDELEFVVNYVNASEGPYRQNVDWMSFDFIGLVRQGMRHHEWVKEKEKDAKFLANQNTVYTFDDSNLEWVGWTVAKLEDENEVEQEGIRQGNCIKDEDSGYISAFVDGDLDLYVLRDTFGGSHAIWGYNTDDGSVAFMEDSPKRYAEERRRTDFPYYKVNVPFLREMISTANQALGLDDDYDDYSYHYDRNATGEDCYDRNREHWRPEIEDEEEEEPEVAAEIQLPDVTNFAQYEDQYGEDNNCWGLALREAEREGRNIDEDTQIYPGSIHWDDIAYEYFNRPRDFQTNLDLLNKWAAVFHNQWQLGDFYEECQRYLEAADLDEEDDSEIKAYKEWVKLHTNPLTGQFQDPRAISPVNLNRLRRQERENAWAFPIPSDEDLASFNGILPASLNPQNRRGEPLQTEIECLSCGGAGGYPESGKECSSCDGTGRMQARATMPDWETRLENRSETGGIPEPAAMIHEQPSGQLFMAKKKWDMTPLSFTEQLKLHLSTIEAKVSHDLSWVAGGRGRGLMLNSGKLITWPVNKKGEPQHPDMYEYLTGHKLPETHSVHDFTEGIPFDINEDGSVNWFSKDTSPDLIADISKIDYRLKTSAINPQEVAQQLAQLEKDDQLLRLQYQELIKQMGGNQNWQAAKAEWDKTHDPNDPFGDAITRTKAQPLIKNNIEIIKQDPNALHNAWLLVQHMDMDPEFQKWFLNYLDPNQRSEKGESDYEYLHDRIQVGMGVPQTYGTQTGAPGVEGNEWNFMAPYYSKTSKTYEGFDVHFHPYTGEPCTCAYGQSSNNRRTASQAVRKVKNQDQKHLRGERGQAILNYLHKLISGHELDEQGQFGQGDIPGLEGMVSWIVKQIKTEQIKPFTYDNGEVFGLGYFSTMDFSSVEEAKKELAGRQQSLISLQQNYEGDYYKTILEDYGYQVDDTYGAVDNPDIDAVLINCDTIGPNDLIDILKRVPEGIRVWIGGSDAISEEIRQTENVERYGLITASEYLKKIFKLNNIDSRKIYFQNHMRRAVLAVESTVREENPDLSNFELPDKYYSSINLEDWANWFNASNAPARRSRTEKEVRGSFNRAEKFIKRNIEQGNTRLNDDINSPMYNDDLVRIMSDELKIKPGDLREAMRNTYKKMQDDDAIDTIDGTVPEENMKEFLKRLTKKFEVNLNDMSPQKVADASINHKKYLREMEELAKLKEKFADKVTDPENIVYRVEDPFYKGWTVYQLKDRDDAELETEVLGHCIGSDEQKYKEGIESGVIAAYSLRDEYGIPKLTWHYNPDGSLARVQGKSGDSYHKFRHIVTEFNEAMGFDDANGGEGSEDNSWFQDFEDETLHTLQMPDPESIEEYMAQVDNLEETAEEYADLLGETLADDCDIERGDPEWNLIADEFFEESHINVGTYQLINALMNELTPPYDLQNFVTAADKIFDRDKEGFIRDGELMGLGERSDDDFFDTYPICRFYDTWRRVHTNPKTNKVEKPVTLWREESYMQRFNPDETPEISYQELPYNRIGIHDEDVAPDMPNYWDASGGTRIMPASMNPQYAPNAVACAKCNGRGRIRSGNGSLDCDECHARGWYVEENPVEKEPGAECQNCGGSGRIQVTDDRGVVTEPCAVCDGLGKTASLTIKQKAAAWDKPAHKLSKAEAQYIDGRL